MVSPGQELAVVVQDASADPVTAIAYVSKNIAEKVSKIEPSILKIGIKLTRNIQLLFQLMLCKEILMPCIMMSRRICPPKRLKKDT